MNTKHIKFISKAIIISLVFLLSCFLFISPKNSRQLANTINDYQYLTENQKIKWNLTQQFQIQQTNESFLIDIPHLIDLCEQNEEIIFVFSATYVAISGDPPQIKYSLSCAKYLIKNNPKAPPQFELLFEDLISTQFSPIKQLAHGILSTKNIYSDELFPIDWRLSEIKLVGQNPLEINFYEIQKVFGHNFDFKLQAQ